MTAIDVAPTAIQLAQERARNAGVSVTWIQANVLVPPPLEPFDLIGHLRRPNFRVDI